MLKYKVTFSKYVAFTVATAIFTAPLLSLSAVSQAQAESSSSNQYSLTVYTSDSLVSADHRNKAKLKANTLGKHTIFRFDKSKNNKVAILTKGTLLSLHFPEGRIKVKILPARGVIEASKAKYHLPRNVNGVLKVVGEGSAIIQVTQTTSINATHNSDYASNWSGYYKTDDPGSFEHISSRWTVPAVKCGTAVSDVSVWVGFDGIDQNGVENDTVLQTGTSAECNNNVAIYYAWWEYFPAPAVGLNCPVSPGNEMAASISKVTGYTYRIHLINVTTDTDCLAPDVEYYGQLSTAEWIVERAATENIFGELEQLPLADFGNMTFTDNQLNGIGPSHNYASETYTMTTTGSPTSAILAMPSETNGAGNSFSVYYCNVPSGCGTPPLTRWTYVAPGSGQYKTDLRSAARSSVNSWVAGREAPGSSPWKSVIYRYTNGSWTKFLPPATAGASLHYINSIKSRSSTSAWAVGTYTGTKAQTLAFKWDGTSWSTVQSDNPGGSNVGHELLGVGDDGVDTWAVGQWSNPSSSSLPLLEKWNGTKFAHQALTLPAGITRAKLNSVDFSSSTNGWAVGGSTSSVEPGPLFYHYDGNSWTPSIGTSSPASLRSVSALSSGEAWAVGSKVVSGVVTPLIMQYANGTWSEVTALSSYDPNTTLNSISASSASNVWIAGQYTDSSGILKPLTLHYDGVAWTKVFTPSHPNVYTALKAISATPDGIWTAGTRDNSSTGTTPYAYLQQSKP
jgi:hypothetical protein